MSTHVIPHGGLSTWTAPDPSRAPVSTAAAGLEVRVLETRGDWARVEFTNSWTGWVDGRALLRSGAAAAWTAWLPGAGAALIVLGSFLPWLTAGRVSASAWDIPLSTLFTHNASSSSIKVGLFLLIALIAIVPYFTHTPFPPLVNVLLAGMATYAAMAGAMLSQKDGSRPGIGLAVTYLGGLVLTVDALLKKPLDG